LRRKKESDGPSFYEEGRRREKKWSGKAWGGKRTATPKKGRIEITCPRMDFSGTRVMKGKKLNNKKRVGRPLKGRKKKSNYKVFRGPFRY